MSEEALVSVVIPVFDCEKYLAAAIESVLAQTYRSIEVIVVNDGSSDRVGEIAAHFGAPVRYTAQSHQGAGSARNTGSRMARGSFLSFLDADDLWVADKLTRQLAVFDSDSNIDMVFGHIEQFHSPEVSEELKSTMAGDGKILTGCSATTLLIKRDSFFHAGLFADHWHLGEFIDWYAKAIDKGLRSHTLSAVLTRRRLHGANMTIRQRPAMIDYVRILKASMDRRRKNGSQ
jgi:glycosyltransferase involved in cell wall biosynthesis